MSDPYKRRMFRGVSLDNRTISALLWAEKRYLEVAPKKRKPFMLAQGSYSTSVNASGQTHAGGGAIDIGAYTLTDRQRKAAVKWLRRAGFAAWYRPPYNGVWGPHIHAILRGHRNASPAAKAQMVAYDNHRDGLAGNAYDKTWRPKRSRRWSHKQRKPIIGK